MNLLANDEYRAFLHAIAQEPEDDTARLVLADWLDENGHPHRAAIIRRGVKNPKRFTHKEGGSAVVAYKENTRRDLGEVVSDRLTSSYLGVRWTTYKGMIESAMMTWETWLGTKEELIANEWLPEVVLTTRPDIVFMGEHTTDPPPCRHVYAVPGRKGHHLVAQGDDSTQAVLRGEWPMVTRWIVPKIVRWLEQYARPGSPHGNHMHNDNPQVGEVVRCFDGTEGTLLAPVDANGFAPVRPSPLS